MVSRLVQKAFLLHMESLLLPNIVFTTPGVQFNLKGLILCSSWSIVQYSLQLGQTTPYNPTRCPPNGFKWRLSCGKSFMCTAHLHLQFSTL